MLLSEFVGCVLQVIVKSKNNFCLTFSQVAAQQLPVVNLLVFDDLKRAIIQRVGRTPEQHRQRFRSLDLGESGRPFAMAQQLRDSCRKWLLAEGSDVEHLIDLVVLEQFIARLPKKTAEWVQCHCPTSLDLAVYLAEDHMARNTLNKEIRAAKRTYSKKLEDQFTSNDFSVEWTESHYQLQDTIPLH
uniref:SCAN box domain-containing protein n=1 Tax=Cyprinus carpio carpio TaxID=630221 RepID=A0A9J8CUW3_CYPCA